MSTGNLSFDGFGVNGPDKYRTRIATFSKSLSEKERKHYGKLFAFSPELLEGLKRIRRTSVQETFHGNVKEFQEWLDGFTEELISNVEE